ncbi:MAG: hypothetical protein Q9183_007460 [Haloplaca sp. 2 TL-2023]
MTDRGKGVHSYSRDIIVSILRIVYLAHLITANDFTQTATNTWIWSVLEPCLAMMVACGPTLRPVIKATLGRKNRETTPTDKHSYPSYPERQHQFSAISDGEHPLQPMYGNTTTANFGTESPETMDSRSDPPLSRDGVLGAQNSEDGFQHKGIKVQRDFTVKRTERLDSSSGV